MNLLSTILGIAMIAASCHDIFHTLFHPAGRGAMSDWLSRGIWTTFRRLANKKPGRITLGGPIIFVSIVGSWALLIVFGFALIYRTNMGAFAVAPGMDPSKHVSFLDALNVSLGALITLGGDFNSRSRIFRLGMGIEAVIGFGLLTAAVSWLLSIYPVLEQRRSLAHKATLLHDAERRTDTSLFDMAPTELFGLLTEITAEVITLRNSMAQFPISYYFHSGERETGLPGILGYLRSIAERAIQGRDASLRIAGTVLSGAIVDYLKLLGEVYVQAPRDDMESILHAYAEDQMRKFVTDGPISSSGQDRMKAA